MMNFTKGLAVPKIGRPLCSKPTTNGEIRPFIFNRNPRNLERLRLARKPVGYTFEEDLVSYWHKLCFSSNSRSIRASLVHNSDYVPITASTDEWCIRKYLYKTTDTFAHIVLAKVFAQRCMEAGINYCESDVVYTEGSKVELFLKTLMKEGLGLREPKPFDIYDRFHTYREKRPWTVLES